MSTNEVRTVLHESHAPLSFLAIDSLSTQHFCSLRRGKATLLQHLSRIVYSTART